MKTSQCGNNALVVGASYAGLVATAALLAEGWNVTVIERSVERLRTGGGVVVQRSMAEYLSLYGIGFPGVPAIPALTRRLYLRDGSIVQMPETATAYSAWDVLLSAIEAQITGAEIKRGVALIDIRREDSGVVARLSDGSVARVDVLIGADGVGSTVRRIVLPDIQPTYAGYVAWRGMVNERDLPAPLLTVFQDALSIYEGDRTTILVYEVPGSNGELDAGARRLNWVWYLNAPSTAERDAILTDRNGVRHRATVGRGLVAEEALTSLRRTARALLSEPFAAVVHATEQPFVQAIDDLLLRQLVYDRVVLIGDAAGLVRPHIGHGTAKAVDDAVTLARALSDEQFTAHHCLRAWEHTRLEVHTALAESAKAVARKVGLGVQTELFTSAVPGPS